jgi:hypothetical protein
MKALDVVGTSMWPVLKNGDTVLVDESMSPQIGDMVARKIDEMIIVHRYLSRGLTKGDRFLEADPEFLEDEETMTVVGLVPRRTKMVGKANFAKQIANGKLESLQTYLSRSQLSTASRLLKRAALAALIINGCVLRFNYKRALRGTANVM